MSTNIVFCILSYNAKPVGDGNKFVWDFYSGGSNFHGKLEMVRGKFWVYTCVINDFVYVWV